MSRTLIEGLAMSRPLIATDVTGCREMVDEGKNGFLCRVKNSKSLEEAMITFIELPFNEREAFSKYSRKKCEEEFNQEKVNQLYCKILKENV
jgi:glycosyltransferase involved in cell wall biosynthesis